MAARPGRAWIAVPAMGIIGLLYALGSGGGALLRVLPGPTVPSGLIAAGTLSGSKGEVITTTRASNKTCTKADGTLTYLSSNVPCVEAQGLLVEGASTNLALQSQALDNAYWTKIGSAGAPTVTADQMTAPDGTLTAEQVVYPAVSSGNYALIRSSAISTSATTYTATTWVYSAGGVSIGLSANSGFNYSMCAVPAGVWTKCSDTRASGGGNQTFDIGWNAPATSAGPGATVFLWGEQYEAQPFATSYIPTTTTSATRAADVITVGSLAIGTKPSWSADIVLEGVAPGSNDNYVFETYNSTSDRYGIEVTITSGLQTGFNNGTQFSALSSSGLITANTKTHVAGYYDGVNLGATVGTSTGTAAASFTPQGTYATTSIGSAAAFSSNYLYGWISNICIAASATGCR